MLKYIVFCFLICLLLPPDIIFAKDINLDSIYIKKTSADYKKLVLEKLDVYQKTGAEFVDRDVIFADWVSGNEIVYVKENGPLKINYIHKYRLADRKNIQLCKINGAVTIARFSPDKKLLVLKLFVLNKPGQIIPRGSTVVIDTETGRHTEQPSDYAFLDFSITPDSGSMLIENKNGIAEFIFSIRNYRQLLAKKAYADIVISDNPSIAHFSPDRQNLLVMNGGGGNYKAKVIKKNGKEIPVNGINLSAEIFWLDNSTLVFSTGYSGNFTVVFFNINGEKTIPVSENSFNTNLCYSAHPKILSFLKEQLIVLYNRQDGKLINTGIEGEDASFDPNGNRFVSLLYKKLFVVNFHTAERKRIELSRTWNNILTLYNNLKKKKKDHENQYSGLYIDRKIKAYSELTGR